jgi:hypothetical protein
VSRNWPASGWSNTATYGNPAVSAITILARNQDPDADDFTNVQEYQFAALHYPDIHLRAEKYVEAALNPDIPGAGYDPAAVETVTIRIEVVGNGRINIGEGVHRIAKYPHACVAPCETSEIILSAMAAEGWAFKQWGGSALGQEESISHSLHDDGYIIAEFVYIGDVLTLDLVYALGQFLEVAEPTATVYTWDANGLIMYGHGEYPYAPNGIPDAVEFRALEFALGHVPLDWARKGGITQESAIAAWRTNVARAAADLASVHPPQGLVHAVAAYMTLGDTGSAAFVRQAVQSALGVTLSRVGYDRHLSVFLVPAEDANMDGINNIEVWNYVSPDALLEDADAYAHGVLGLSAIPEEARVSSTKSLMQPDDCQPTERNAVFVGHAPFSHGLGEVHAEGVQSLPTTFPYNAGGVYQSDAISLIAKETGGIFRFWSSDVPSMISRSLNPREKTEVTANTVYAGWFESLASGFNINWNTQAGHVEIVGGQKTLVPGYSQGYYNVYGTRNELITIKATAKAGYFVQGIVEVSNSGDGQVTMHGSQARIPIVGGLPRDLEGSLHDRICTQSVWVSFLQTQPEPDSLGDVVLQVSGKGTGALGNGQGSCFPSHMRATRGSMVTASVTTDHGWAVSHYEIFDGERMLSSIPAQFPVTGTTHGDSVAFCLDGPFARVRAVLYENTPGQLKIERDLMNPGGAEGATPICAGYVTADPATKYYQPGAFVTLTAHAREGYFLARWTGEGNIYNSDGNPIPNKKLDAGEDEHDKWVRDRYIRIKMLEDGTPEMRTITAVFHPCVHCGTMKNGSLVGDTRIDPSSLTDGFQLQTSRQNGCWHFILRIVYEVGAIWHAEYPDRDFWITGISALGGGGRPGNGSSNHWNGKNLDIRYVRLSNGTTGFHLPNADYDQAATQRLVDLFFAAGAERLITCEDAALTVPPGKKIYNDPSTVHTNHFHLDFEENIGYVAPNQCPICEDDCPPMEE